MCEGATPSVEFTFTDGSSWSFVVEPKPNVEMMFAYSHRDEDSIQAKIPEE